MFFGDPCVVVVQCSSCDAHLSSWRLLTPGSVTGCCNIAVLLGCLLAITAVVVFTSFAWISTSSFDDVRKLKPAVSLFDKEAVDKFKPVATSSYLEKTPLGGDIVVGHVINWTLNGQVRGRL